MSRSYLAVCVVLAAPLLLACSTNPEIAAPGGGAGATGTGTGTGMGNGNAGTGIKFMIPTGAAGSGAAGNGGGTPSAGPCVNLCKQRMACAQGADTTVSGIVYAPTPPKFGMPDPIYNAIVYVPNEALQPLPQGVSCSTCRPPSGAPLSAVLTGADGRFTLKNVPVGDNIPLVIQVGGWRRQVKIPKVAPCTNTDLSAELTRLPRNKSEGDIPLTAISTGNADALECVLRKIGIDEAEFTLPAAGGRVHLYKANGSHAGDATPPSATLTGSADLLRQYDMVILECEGGASEKPEPDKQNLVRYADEGGRMFVTHYEYTYLYNITPFSMVSDWKVRQGNPTVNNAPLTGIIDQSFPKGQAFAQWLQNVGASYQMKGQIQIFTPRHDLDTVVPPAQRWIYSQAPDTTQQLTFNTPVGAPEAKQCGRVLFSDFHVSDVKNISVQFPTECNDLPMTAQEKVLEFLLFDLASCVQPDGKPPRIVD